MGVITVLIILSWGIPMAASAHPSVNTSAASKESTRDLTSLNEHVRYLDQRVDEEIKHMQEQSKIVMDAQRDLGKQTIEAQTLYINIISIAIGILTLAGFAGVGRLWKYSERARKEAGSITELRQEASRNQINVKALVAVTRVMSKIWESDMAQTPLEKMRHANKALVELEEAERLMGVRSAELLLEKGRALKRMNRYRDALTQADKACDLAISEDNRFDEARAHYNAACYEALLNNTEGSLKRLEQAINISSAFKLFATTDDDLKSVQGEADFMRLTKASAEGKKGA
jgi:tetratricopeptide (TPR) repeat protein